MLFENLNDKRLIFTLSTGRSGTGYLAKVMSLIPTVASYHEPEPSFANVMRLVQSNSKIACDFWLNRKLPQIAQNCQPVYLETSHLFCKGFIEPLLDLGYMPDVIILTRPHREVAMSLYRLNTIPGRTAKGLKYLLSPTDPNILALPGWEILDDYQLCFWYCLEIEARILYYKSLLSRLGGQTARITLNQIITFGGFYRFLDELNLPKPRYYNWLRYLRFRKQRTNQKIDINRSSLTVKQVDQLEKDVRAIAFIKFPNKS